MGVTDINDGNVTPSARFLLLSGSVACIPLSRCHRKGCGDTEWRESQHYTAVCGVSPGLSPHMCPVSLKVGAPLTPIRRGARAGHVTLTDATELLQGPPATMHCISPSTTFPLHLPDRCQERWLRRCPAGLPAPSPFTPSCHRCGCLPIS